MHLQFVELNRFQESLLVFENLLLFGALLEVDAADALFVLDVMKFLE